MKLIAKPVLPSLPEPDFSQLVESIGQHGVLVPILVTDQGEIIDGHERHRACEKIGLRRYPIRVMGNLSEPERREYAIRLNCERRHLTRAEKRRLLGEYIAVAPHKSTRELADLLRVGKSTVSRVRADVLATVPVGTVEIRGRNGKTYKYKPAVSCENGQRAQEAGRLLSELGSRAPSGGVTLRTLRQAAHEQRTQAEASGPIARLPVECRIEHCSFVDLERHVGDLKGTVDVICTDPPWKEDYSGIRRPFAEWAARVLKPGGVCCFYCGHLAVPGFLAAFEGLLDYRWLGAALNHVNRRPLRVAGNIETGFRPFLVFSKGQFKLPKTLQDVLRCDDLAEPRHPLRWDQPLGEVVRLLESISRPGSLCLDPFVGSGTTAEAVLRIGQGRRVICCDSSATCVRLTRMRVGEANRKAQGA